MDGTDNKIMTQPEKVFYIVNGVCDYFGINPKKIKEIRRGGRGTIPEARRFMSLLLTKYTVLSQREIADNTGIIRHQTINYHCNRLEEELSDNFYGAEKTKMIYNELLSYLNLTNYENKENHQGKETRT